MGKRKKKQKCVRCEGIRQLEQIALRELRAKRVRFDQIGHLLELIRGFEGMSCSCGKCTIAGERVGALLDLGAGS